MQLNKWNTVQHTFHVFNFIWSLSLHAVYKIWQPISSNVENNINRRDKLGISCAKLKQVNFAGVSLFQKNFLDFFKINLRYLNI